MRARGKLRWRLGREGKGRRGCDPTACEDQTVTHDKTE